MCKFCHRPAPFLNNANEAKSKRFFLFSNKSALKKITLISRVTHIPYLQRNGALLYYAFFHDLKGKFIKNCGLAGGAPLSCLQQRPSQRYVMYDSVERGMHDGKLATPESHSTLPSCCSISIHLWRDVLSRHTQEDMTLRFHSHCDVGNRRGCIIHCHLAFAPTYEFRTLICICKLSYPTR